MTNQPQPSARGVAFADWHSLPQLWGRRGFWQIRLRWLVAPVMIVGVIAAEALGFALDRRWILGLALASPVYNAAFAVVFRRFADRAATDERLDRLLVVIEVLVDYTAMLLLLHATGGATSPLAFLLLFHVLIGAIQFSPGTAYSFAGLASAGLWGLHFGQVAGWWSSSRLAFRGQPIDLLDRPVAASVQVLMLTVTLFLAAAMVSRIMGQLRRRVDELAAASAEIERLLADRIQFTLQVAHNLRAPLGAALSLLELLRTGHVGVLEARQIGLVERVDERLRALDRTAGQLLTIARTRDFSREIPDVLVDLDELAAEVEQTFAEDAARRSLRLTVTCGPGLPKVESGVDLLSEMMENLVSNALRYTPAGGEVTVDFRCGEPGEVRIEVTDTGIGIPDGEQGKLFQEFFRGANAKRHAPAGTGLGLALVKRTVDRHHGRVQITSREGHGTRVRVDIPTRRIGVPGAAAAGP